MKRIALFAVAVAWLLTLASAHAADKVFKAVLVGDEEVPVVMTGANGGFIARLNADGTALDYELSYDGLEGSVTQAHIHIGQSGANGGIAVWLCSNLASPPTPAGVQACPASGTITGTISASDVVAIATQSVAAGDFEAVVSALNRGLAYANVHTNTSPGGEIRSQLDHSGHN